MCLFGKQAPEVNFPEYLATHRIYAHNIVFRINIGVKNPVDIFQLVQQFDRFLVVKYFDGPHYLHGIARVQKTDQMGAIAKEQVPPVRSQPPAVDSFRVGEFSCLIQARSEEHTSELQSLMRMSYSVFCLQKKKIYTN